MEQTNLPIVAKKLWNTVRVMFFMLKKGILKKKFMIDLNAMITRGKIAGKAIHNLMFHHAHHSFPHVFVPRKQKQHTMFFQCAQPNTDDEMTIINNADRKGLEMVNEDVAASPYVFAPRKQKQHTMFFQCAQLPDTDDDMTIINNADRKGLETVNEDVEASPAVWHSAVSSPAIFGFGWSPAQVKQVRITDSPFPMRVVDEDIHVDKAAEEFIAKFYDRLKRQNNMSFG